MQTTSEFADVIDSLIIVIKNMDPVGDRIDIGKDMLLNTPVGNRLQEHVKAIHHLSSRSLTD